MEAQIKRKHSKVPFAEVEPLLSQALQCCDGRQSELAEALGYAGTYNLKGEWAKVGEVPLRAKYALIGFLSEMRVPLERKIVKQFNHNELALLFGALIGVSLSDEEQKTLKAKLAKELTSA